MTNRSHPPDAASVPQATSDTHSVWVSSVIPGLTVQVIDPMPPSLEGVGRDSKDGLSDSASESQADRDCPSSAHHDGLSQPDNKSRPAPRARALNRLMPKNDRRSRHRRSRLLRLRETARDAVKTGGLASPAALEITEQATAAVERDDLAAAAQPPSASKNRPSTGPAVDATESDRAPLTDGSSAADRVDRADRGDRADRELAVEEPLTQRVSSDWFPVDELASDEERSDEEGLSSDRELSSDEVISITRSELGSALERPSAPAAPATPTSRRRPLPPCLPIGTSRPRGSRPVASRRHSRPQPPSADELTEERYADWFRRVVLRNRWLSVFTTFYIHWLILLALGMMVVHGPQNAAALLLNGAFSDTPPVQSFDISVPEPVPLDDPEPAENDKAISAADLRAAELDERPPALDTSVMQGLLKELPMSNIGATVANSVQPATAAESTSPAPPRAVSEGSFSVWTEPSAPEAGEPYRIIVQIRLPPGMEQYDVSDLQGVVVGSDGYRKPIPGALTGLLPVQDGYARLVIPIVSADEHVRDTVLIKSRQLRESQKLLIAFAPGV